MKITRFWFFPLILIGLTLTFLLARYLVNFSNRARDIKSNGLKVAETAIPVGNPQLFRQRYLTIISRIADDEALRQTVKKGNGTPIEQMILEAALLHRTGEYAAMYEKLSAPFGFNIPYYEYYDEMSFAAVATGNLPKLQNLVKERPDTNSANYFYCQGLLAQSTSQFSRAAELYEKCLVKDPKAGLAALHCAVCLVNAGKSDEGLKTVEKYKDLLAADTAMKTEDLLLRGVVSYFLGDVQKARAFYNETLAMAAKAGLASYEARAMVNVGILLDQQGNIDEARQLYRAAVAKARRINDAYSNGLAHGELGVSYSYANELSDALAEYKAALGYYAGIKNDFRMSLTYANIGNIYVSIGDLPSAKTAFEKGLSLSNNAPRSQCLNAIGLGDIYTNTGNYAEALRLYEQAKEQLQRAKLYDLRSSVNLSIGALSYSIGRYQSSIQACSESLDGKENSVNSPLDATRLYRQIGLAYYGMDSLKQALDNFEEARKIAAQYNLGTDKFRVLLDEANLLIDKEKVREAGARIAGAVTSFSSVQVSEQLYYHSTNLRYALAEKNYTLAAKTVAAGDKLFALATHQETKAEFLFETANYYSRLGDQGKASEKYIAAISLLESASATLLPYQKLHISRRTAVYDIYEKVIAYFISQKRYDEAFTILDHARAKNSFYAINERMFANANFSKEDFEKYQELGWMIESGLYGKSKVDSLLQVRHVYELKGKLAGFFRDEGYIQSPKSYIANIQSKLSESSYVVSLFTGENESRYFIISRHGFVSVAAPVGTDAVQNLLSQVSMRFSKNTGAQLPVNSDLFAFHAGKAHQLYDQVFRPAFNLIPENSEVIFIPSEEFYSFPIELLVKSFDEAQSPYKYSGVDFLVQHYTISSAPSAEIFTRLMDEQQNESANVLVIGNPSFGNNRGVFAERRGLFEDNSGMPRNVTLYPLKYSEDEIESVRDKFKSVSFYNGSDATETNFKEQAEKSGIIHLSTHSWLIGKQPAIFFSPEPDSLNDGILEAGEVAQLNLHANLVALSSCNSGEGLHEASEGIVGMTKAFLDAGAASVVVSLWEVNDRYTAEFMKLFYSGLREGKTKPQALREAKQKFIQDISPNPYYWSGFVLVGNVDPLPAEFIGSTTNKALYLAAGFFLAILLLLLRKIYRVKTAINTR